jgi:2,4-dienoyl-CoA reductase-like NADH-dependent reductase (Old Yellow Enzyme family)
VVQCFKLESWGVTLIELTGGSYENLPWLEGHKKDSTKKREAYFIEFGEKVRPHLKTAKLCVTGGFRSTAGMAGAIREGATDMCGLGRPVTAEPDIPGKLISGQEERAKKNCLEGASAAASYTQLGEVRGTSCQVACLIQYPDRCGAPYIGS